MMHYLLFYEVAPDYLKRRGEFRLAHLEHAWAAHARGELLLGGALAEPVDGAVLLFQCDTPDVVQRFAETDPYVTNELVTNFQVRPWTTVVGDTAATPIKPDAL
jgi:uncharacterized protein